MRGFLDDLGRFFGIAQGIFFVIGNLGVGAVVLGLVSGTLALASDLPWWSVALVGSGAFMVTTGSIGGLGRWIAGMRASPLTPPIDAGLQLRARLVAVTDEGAPEQERDRWKARLEDWIEDAAAAIYEVAPHRVGNFRMDYLYASTGPWYSPGPETALPEWVREILAELDARLDRIENIRASI